jgi:hypothetical protein
MNNFIGIFNLITVDPENLVHAHVPEISPAAHGHDLGIKVLLISQIQIIEN